jgi:hypothetical protein
MVYNWISPVVKKNAFKTVISTKINNFENHVSAISMALKRETKNLR